MKLKSFNRYISLLILITLFLPLKAEDEIDIWNKEKIENNNKDKLENNTINQSINVSDINKIKKNQNVLIENEILKPTQEIKIFGIHDPAENNFNLNMWSSTNAEDVRSSIKRINKINLSKTSKKIFENTFFSFAYPPNGMDDKEFINLKINWMIENKRSDLIEKFLKQNNTFHNKKKVIQYLVDENIA